MNKNIKVTNSGIAYIPINDILSEDVENTKKTLEKFSKYFKEVVLKEDKKTLPKSKEVLREKK